MRKKESKEISLLREENARLKALLTKHGIPLEETTAPEQATIEHSEQTTHQYREGNGRLARLLATLMALQAGLPPLDFSGFEQERQGEYFTAVRYGLDRDYKPMEKVFTDVITRSLQAYEE